MTVLELFCGTKSFSNVADRYGLQTFTVDNDPRFKPSLCTDIQELTVDDIPFRPYILWASPPCTCFSVASISTHWKKDGEIVTPKTEAARVLLGLVSKTLALINQLDPVFWYIENPRGMLRRLGVMRALHKYTVTYCQYGDTRMKPTDIWTNHVAWTPKPACKSGDTCHEAAPRGSKTGTQGRKGSIERSRIPPALCEEIIKNILQQKAGRGVRCRKK